MAAEGVADQPAKQKQGGESRERNVSGKGPTVSGARER